MIPVRSSDFDGSNNREFLEFHLPINEQHPRLSLLQREHEEFLSLCHQNITVDLTNSPILSFCCLGSWMWVFFKQRRHVGPSICHYNSAPHYHTFIVPPPFHIVVTHIEEESTIDFSLHTQFFQKNQGNTVVNRTKK